MICHYLASELPHCNMCDCHGDFFYWHWFRILSGRISVLFLSQHLLSFLMSSPNRHFYYPSRGHFNQSCITVIAFPWFFYTSEVVVSLITLIWECRIRWNCYSCSKVNSIVRLHKICKVKKQLQGKKDKSLHFSDSSFLCLTRNAQFIFFFPVSKGWSSIGGWRAIQLWVFPPGVLSRSNVLRDVVHLLEPWKYHQEVWKPCLITCLVNFLNSRKQFMKLTLWTKLGGSSMWVGQARGWKSSMNGSQPRSTVSSRHMFCLAISIYFRSFDHIISHKQSSHFPLIHTA